MVKMLFIQTPNEYPNKLQWMAFFANKKVNVTTQYKATTFALDKFE